MTVQPFLVGMLKTAYAPAGDRLAAEHHVGAELDLGRAIGACAPQLAVRNELAEDSAAFLARAAVGDRHVGQTDALHHLGRRAGLRQLKAALCRGGRGQQRNEGEGEGKKFCSSWLLSRRPSSLGRAHTGAEPERQGKARAPLRIPAIFCPAVRRPADVSFRPKTSYHLQNRACGRVWEQQTSRFPVRNGACSLLDISRSSWDRYRPPRPRLA